VADTVQETVIRKAVLSQNLASRLSGTTSSLVTPSVLAIDNALQHGMSRCMISSTNGLNFVSTVLMGSLLPAIGFHCATRTGHIDLLDVFRFKF
jgi:hypothetical protein